MHKYVPAKEVARPLRVNMPGMYNEACRILKGYGIDAAEMDITTKRDLRRLLDITIYQEQWGEPGMVDG